MENGNKPMALLDAALEAHQRGDLVEAGKLYASLLAEQPDHADALALSGVLASSLGQHDKAINLIKKALALDPLAALFSFYLGNAYLTAQKWEDAAKAYENATHFNPDFAQAFFFLGLALNRCDEHEKAALAYGRAFDLQPDMHEALYNLAMTHQTLGEHEKARETFQQLLEASGQALDDETLLTCAESRLGKWHFHLSLLELLLGDYRRGFARYRARFSMQKRPSFAAPLWRGEDLRDKTILLYAEKGFGDALTFLRYLPHVKEKGGRIIVICKAPLMPLLSFLPEIDEIVEEGSPLPSFDYYASLFDLPYLFGTTLETVPLVLPYVSVPCRTEQNALPVRETQKTKIGIVWAGNPAFGTDRLRSLPFSIFAKLFDSKKILENTAFYNLTREATPEDVAHILSKGGHDLVPHIRNFADTACFVAQLDLIICCDTAIGHLAGAMGKKVWTLVTKEPDWRWGLHQETSLWYPSMRLFRQSAKGDWLAVILAVRNELEKEEPDSFLMRP
jgi:Flp pilus assembly protein TadD